jgi:hypothetical protein
MRFPPSRDTFPEELASCRSADDVDALLEMRGYAGFTATREETAAALGRKRELERRAGR